MNEYVERLVEAYEAYEKTGRDYEYWMFDRTARLAETTIFCKYRCDTYMEFRNLVKAEDLEILILISRLRTLVAFLNKEKLTDDIGKSFYEYKYKFKN
jgi:hypothetical protein